jgi:hypothetical protein
MELLSYLKIMFFSMKITENTEGSFFFHRFRLHQYFALFINDFVFC